MADWLQYVLGACLVVLVLADVYLTVLYARIGAGVISQRLAKVTWWAFRAASRPFRRHRDAALSFCGPTILVLLVALWLCGLMCGLALIIHPQLGTGITATSGPTPTDFATAMYVAGDTLSTVGTSDLAPRTAFYRLLYAVNSFVGISIITLTLTYFLEIYNALQRRNTFALKVHLATAETGDAAELVAGLGAGGEFQSGYTHLAEMSAEMADFKESHHFYSVLLYFRFSDPHYAVSRLSLVSLDAVTLIKSGLDDQRYAWLKESAAVAQLWRGTMRLTTIIATTFLPGGLPQQPDGPDEQSKDRWRQRYLVALRRLRAAGIQTIADERAGAEVYVSLRAQWDRYVRAIADHMAHDLDNIDPAGINIEAAAARQAFQNRLRAAG